MTERVDVQSHKIMSMETEKRDRFINAAMLEFCKGYKSASTENIVREAGISKGLLFHYFGSKEGLYKFLVWYSFDTMTKEYYSMINLKQPDILEVFWQSMLLKIDLAHKHPAIFEFVVAAYSNAKDDPVDEFGNMFRALQTDFLTGISGGIDRGLFKDGIDVSKAFNIIWWTLKGYSDSQIGSITTVESYTEGYERRLRDMKEYFDIFRSVFYKNGEGRNER